MPHQLSTQSHKSIFKFPTNFGKYRKMIEYHIVTIVTIILVTDFLKVNYINYFAKNKILSRINILVHIRHRMMYLIHKNYENHLYANSVYMQMNCI